MMQSNHNEIPKVDAKENSFSLSENFHFILVADESGIIPAFKILKTKLSSNYNNYLTLIYSVSKQINKPLFKLELENFEKRFNSQFLAYYNFNKKGIEYDKLVFNNRITELVINCNTHPFFQFFVFGETIFIDMISNQLHFLGINKNQISIQTIEKQNL